MLGMWVQAEAEAEQLGAAFEALAEAALAADGSRTADGLAATAADETSAAEQRGAEVSQPAAAAAAAAGDSCGSEGARSAESRVELLQRADAAEQVGVG
jgi:hypothetical protein